MQRSASRTVPRTRWPEMRWVSFYGFAVLLQRGCQQFFNTARVSLLVCALGFALLLFDGTGDKACYGLTRALRLFGRCTFGEDLQSLGVLSRVVGAILAKMVQ